MNSFGISKEHAARFIRKVSLFGKIVVCFGGIFIIASMYALLNPTMEISINKVPTTSAYAKLSLLVFSLIYTGVGSILAFYPRFLFGRILGHFTDDENDKQPTIPNQ